MFCRKTFLYKTRKKKKKLYFKYLFIRLNQVVFARFKFTQNIIK